MLRSNRYRGLHGNGHCMKQQNPEAFQNEGGYFPGVTTIGTNKNHHLANRRSVANVKSCGKKIVRGLAYKRDFLYLTVTKLLF